MKNVAYKLFKVYASKPGKLFPLYVNADKEVPVGEWLDAENGEMTNNGKVKSKLGELCFRPGWHLSDYPIAVHIGMKNENGVIEFMKPDTVWCECSYSDIINYQMEANKNGTNKKGVLIPKNAYLKNIPENGFYRYKTNPVQLGDWIIAGKIKVERVMTDEEVEEMLRKNGIQPMKRWGEFFDNEKYGFKIS